MQPGAVQESKTWIMQTLLFNLKNALEYVKNAAQDAPGAQNLDHANPVVQPTNALEYLKNAAKIQFFKKMNRLLATKLARHKVADQ